MDTENEQQSVETPQKPQGWWGKVSAEKLTRGERAWAVLFGIIFLFLFYVTLDANKYQALVHVVEGEGRVGVNPTAERLDFGDLSRGTAAVRTVTIKNDTFMPFFVSVVRVGSITGLMSLSENNVMLRKGEEKKIEFTTYMPASAEIDRKYTGRVFVFKIPAPFF